jgi:hypothetical protein
MEAVSEQQPPEPAPSVPTEQEPPVVRAQSWLADRYVQSLTPLRAQAPQLTQEQEQEAKLRARYGGLVPKKGLLSLSRKVRSCRGQPGRAWPPRPGCGHL